MTSCQDWYFFGGQRLSQEPSMSCILNCESAVIDAAAKEASSSFTVSSSVDHRLPHGFWLQHGPWTATMTWGISTDQSLSMVSGASTGHQPQTSAWPLVVAWTMDIHMTSCRITEHGHIHDFLQQHRQQTSSGASGGSTGHTHYHFFHSQVSLWLD